MGHTIDLCSVATLSHILAFKQELQSDEADLSFLRRFSLAVLHAINGDEGSRDDSRTIIFTSPAALTEIGVSAADRATQQGQAHAAGCPRCAGRRLNAYLHLPAGWPVGARDLPTRTAQGLEGHGGRHARSAGPLQAAVTDLGSAGTTHG